MVVSVGGVGVGRGEPIIPLPSLDSTDVAAATPRVDATTDADVGGAVAAAVAGDGGAAMQLGGAPCGIAAADRVEWLPTTSAQQRCPAARRRRRTCRRWRRLLLWSVLPAEPEEKVRWASAGILLLPNTGHTRPPPQWRRLTVMGCFHWLVDPGWWSVRGRVRAAAAAAAAVPQPAMAVAAAMDLVRVSRGKKRRRCSAGRPPRCWPRLRRSPT